MQMNWQGCPANFRDYGKPSSTKPVIHRFICQVIIALLIIIGFVIVRWLGAHLVKRALRSVAHRKYRVRVSPADFLRIRHDRINCATRCRYSDSHIRSTRRLSHWCRLWCTEPAKQFDLRHHSGARAIRIGDIVELEGRGRVEEIGNRCVRIRRYDGVHVVRIATFSSNGWLTGPGISGYSLGSLSRRCLWLAGRESQDLMQQSAEEHEKVSKDYPVEVFFEEFGDNALTFNLFFWTSVHQPMDIRRVQSDVRFKINALFAEHNIVIAFPQRDIHLDTSKPLEIHLKDPSEQQKGA